MKPYPLESRRLSTYPIHTLRNDPADSAVFSDRYLIRAGFLKKLNAGIFGIYPIGLRVLRKIEAVIRYEMDASGAVEISLPHLVDAELWRQSGRWKVMGEELFRLQDRKQKDFLLGATHEETITQMMKQLLKSYRDLPLNVYQIQTKFRDELRPRFGVIRGREFLMKDAYSFHLSEECLHREYLNMRECYKRIFDSFGLRCMIYSADTGAMGGSKSEEFIIPSEIGEEEYVYSGKGEKKDYRSARENTIVDWSKISPVFFWQKWKNHNAKNYKITPLSKSQYPYQYTTLPQQDIHLVFTPNLKHIDDLANFLKCSPQNILKSLLFRYTNSTSKNNYCLACLRGDCSINEIQLKKILQAFELSLTDIEETQSLLAKKKTSKSDSKSTFDTELLHGFIGPVYNKKSESLQVSLFLSTIVAQNSKDQLSISWQPLLLENFCILFDKSLTTQKDWIVGANCPDYHIINFVLPHANENPHLYDDFSLAKAGDFPLVDNKDASGLRKNLSSLSVMRGLELGHLFQLGDKYTQNLKLQVLDQQGKAVYLLMGCYGIGVDRTMAAMVEQNSIAGQVLWPQIVSPFDIILITLVHDAKVIEFVEKFYQELIQKTKLEVVWDDRKLQNGVKLNDAELLGIPWQIRIGKDYLENECLEVFHRQLGAEQIIYSKKSISGNLSHLTEQVIKLFL